MLAEVSHPVISGHSRWTEFSTYASLLGRFKLLFDQQHLGGGGCCSGHWSLSNLSSWSISITKAAVGGFLGGGVYWCSGGDQSHAGGTNKMTTRLSLRDSLVIDVARVESEIRN